MNEKKASGCFTWVIIAALVLVFLVIANGNKTAASVKELSGAPKSSAAPKETALPGSAAEAVQNGNLTMADIKHRADAIGWSTDAWQEWEGGRWGWSGAAGEMEIIRCILRNSAGTGIPANTAAGRHHPDSG